jgi:hypothetical protein
VDASFVILAHDDDTIVGMVWKAVVKVVLTQCARNCLRTIEHLWQRIHTISATLVWE